MEIAVPKADGGPGEFEDAETSTFAAPPTTLPPESNMPSSHIDLTNEEDGTAGMSSQQYNGAMSGNVTNMDPVTESMMSAQASSSRLHTPLGPSPSAQPLYSHQLRYPQLPPHPLSSSSHSPYPQASPSASVLSHRPTDDDNDIQITGSNIISPQIQRLYPGMTNGSHHNGHGSSNGTNGNGTNGYTADSAIDLTDVRLPSPPPVKDTKKPICIGAVQSRAIVLYPSAAIIAGAHPPPNVKERFSTLMYNGAELIKAKLKLRLPGAQPKPGEVWSPVQRPTLQVMTPGQSCFIGDLDFHLADILIPHVQRGILRLEAFVQRLPADVSTFEVRLNVIFFTLHSNVGHIADNLIRNNIFLLDPVPPYDPNRHSDRPQYLNGHGGQEYALAMMQAAHRRAYSGHPGGSGSWDMGMGSAQADKAKQVEVQRAQVDEVFKSMESGGGLDMSDPGPYIKSDLFPHQRKALTFLLQREQDYVSLKAARKAQIKKEAKKRRNAKESTVEEKVDGDAEEAKAKAKDLGRSLWEPKEHDEKGKIRVWRHAITGDEVRGKKDKPAECKGSILADDMGLGKTLTVISMIAATRREAVRWGKSKIEKPSKPGKEEKDDGLSVNEMKTRVFGMPDIESENGTPQPGLASTKSKKRKLDATGEPPSARRARIVTRSKATLLLCPMSTITNWEDQLRDHWDGNVEVVGGAKGLTPPKVTVKKYRPPGESSDDDDDFDVLRVYIYHGQSRRPDPNYIGDFDLVITSYNTLALEYSKQNNSGDDTPTTPAETAGNSDEESATPGDSLLVDGKAINPEVQRAITTSEVADGLKRKGKGKANGAPQTSPLQAIDWFRVVLDEAHYIKTATTVASQAACDLEADRRMALTGTPIQNKIDDVWALFKFLRISPIDEKDIFTKFISAPCKTGEQIGLARLQLVMRCCTLRRTKETKTENGEKILNLPPRKETQVWLDLTPEEREVYDSRVIHLKEKVQEFQKAGELSKNYANVLQEILRLRQTCDHVDLVKSGAVEEDYDGTIMDWDSAVKGIETHGFNQARAVSIMAYLKQGTAGGTGCYVCKTDVGEYYPSIGLGGVEEDDQGKGKGKKLPFKPLLTKCHHILCPKCFKTAVYPGWSKRMKETVSRPCACGQMIRIPRDVTEVLPPDYEDKEKDDDVKESKNRRQKYSRKPGEELKLSTKMRYLFDELMKNSKRNPHSPHYDAFVKNEGDDDVMEVDRDSKPYIIKSVVFSQWTTMLDRIGDMLEEAKIQYCRLDGTMSRDDRAAAMEDLKKKKKIEVMLVSTRAGGVGLNLTAACRVYLVDPYWNPAVESQAIDRIHRMGQQRPVEAVRLMISDSIEQRLDAIQKKKANLANLSLKAMSRKELMEQKADELAQLFA